MEKTLRKDLSHYYSDVTKLRQGSSMEKYLEYLRIPGMANLAGGYPDPQLFPFDTLEAQIAVPKRWAPTPDQPDLDGSRATALIESAVSLADSIGASRIVVPHSISNKDPVYKLDIASALQYGHPEGYPPLLSFIRQFSRNHLHPKVPYKDGPEVILTVGSTDGISKVLDLFTNVWIEGKSKIEDRPGLLCDVFMFTNVLKQARPRGMQIVPVEIDDNGPVAYGPGGLEEILANWNSSTGKRPHLLYSVSVGHNPTGIVFPHKRKKEIYAVCSKYDVIIIEDEPYWFLQYPSAGIEEAKARGTPIPEVGSGNSLEVNSGYTFLDSLTPSFLNIDTDGRVIRLDTFSKTVAPGCRLGWITATPEICEKILLITESGSLQPSGFVQSLVAQTIIGSQEGDVAQFLDSSPEQKPIFSGWQMDGWVRWLAGLRGVYERRMNRTCSILEKGSWRTGGSSSLKDGVSTRTQIYSFNWPRGGMSVWIKLHFERHPLWRSTGSHNNVIDGPALSIAMLVHLTRKPYLILLSPGTGYSATEQIRTERGWAYCRLCFAAEAEDYLDECSERFVQGLQSFWLIEKVEEIENLLKV